jgi:predicted SAM-dependent methyltransferase
MNPFQVKAARVCNLKYLNIGCGKKMFNHTINLNYEWYPGVDLTWDITKKRLPFREGQLDGIYTEHVIEHLPPSRLPFVFGEWSRCLRSKGVMRILVPDAEIYLRTYCRIQNGDDIKFPYHIEEATPMEHVNRVFRTYDHLYAYDYETLSKILSAAGFSSINRCRHREGRDAKLLLDSDDREVESLRVECIVPQT